MFIIFHFYNILQESSVSFTFFFIYSFLLYFSSIIIISVVSATEKVYENTFYLIYRMGTQ